MGRAYLPIFRNIRPRFLDFKRFHRSDFGVPRALVIVPTYDERENLPRLVPLILEQDPAIEILVVDDGSPDGTGQLAEGMARSEPRLHVLHRPAKLGLGTAYVAGFKWGLEREFDYFFEMD